MDKFPEDVTQRADDRGHLLEYSVVYTDRAVNLMAKPFVAVMNSLSSSLKKAYNAQHVALIPGSGTFGMESVARALSLPTSKFMVIRNGFFSFRWTQIFDSLDKNSKHFVFKANFNKETKQVTPADLDTVISSIKAEKPSAVFLPQVETSTGVVLSDSYIKSIADAVHENGGYLVVDAIAAGTLWLDISAVGADFLISAPQKGWSSPACAGIVVMSENGYDAVMNKENDCTCPSFSMSLAQWCTVMKQYEAGGFKYYTTLPTDSLTQFAKNADELFEFGLDESKLKAMELGTKVRKMLSDMGYASVAAEDVESPTVVVVYRKEGLTLNVGAELKNYGVQIAGGVPFKIDEPEGTHANTFRIGLFGLDKLKNVDRTVQLLKEAVEKLN